MRKYRSIVAIAVIAILVSAELRGGSLDEKLPAFQVTDWIQGNSGDLGHWGDGKVYVLDLWGTWCLPCIANIPELTRLQEKYRSRGLVVIGYAWEDPKKLRSFVSKMGDKMKYAVVTDTKEAWLNELTRREMVESFPYAFLVDGSGKVVWRGNPKDDNLFNAVDLLFSQTQKKQNRKVRYLNDE